MTSHQTPAHDGGADTTPVSFSFEGRTVQAVPGQSIAGALQATGVRTLSRSVKYHTPRGYVCGFGACGGCALTVDGAPGTLSCVTPARAGQVVSREQGLPTAAFDLLRTADLMRPWLGAGFQFRLFAKQPRLSKLAGYFLSILAGGGRMPTPAASHRARITRVDRISTPIAIIGGGVSGLTAALTAAARGIDVTVVDRDFSGGRSGVRTESVTDHEIPVELPRLHARLLEQVRREPRITTLEGVAIGWIDGLLPVVNGSVRTELTPERVVIATGSYETPLLFANHDRPGVMFADAALKLAEIEGAAPGRRAVLVSSDARSAAVAERLRSSGIEILETLPAERVERVFGWGRARGVVASTPSGATRKIRADLVVVVGPRRPTEELALHLAYAEAGTHDQVSSDTVELRGPVVRVGTSTGESSYSLEAVRSAVTELITTQTASIAGTNAAPER